MLRTRRQPRLAATSMPIGVPEWARCAAAYPAAATLAHVRISDAIALDGSALRIAVCDAYARLFSAVGKQHLVRVWNVLPAICEALGDGDRYMAFNAGRYDAMRLRFGDRLPRCVPAATGVGGREVTISALATREPGEPIENPMQTPAYRYSERYGTLPPCFARATRAILPAGPRLLVSGTAAIVGEETRGLGDADAQLAITLDNLRGLLIADGGDGSLDQFEHVRAYLPPATIDDARLRGAIREAFATCEAVEFVAAELCRRDLLVEIEGVARRDRR